MTPRRLLSPLTSLLLALGALSGMTLLTASPASAGVTVYAVPTSSAGLGRIVTAPDGNMWFVEQDANKIGRITPTGQITELAFPAQFPGTTTLPDLDIAPDGSIWVLYQQGQNVARLSPDGTVQATGSTGYYANAIRVAADGTVWITGTSSGEASVTRISNGTIYDVPNSPACQDALAIARDGGVWCREDGANLAKVNPAGGGQIFPLAPEAAEYPYALAPGPVGSIWFGKYFGGTIGFSPDDGSVGYLDQATGAATIFDTGSRTAPADLVQGPDGAMWFTSIGAAKGIGHLRSNGTGGALTQVGAYEPVALTFGRDGAVWFTDENSNNIVRVTTDQLQTTNVDPGEGSVLTGSGTGAVGTLRAPKSTIRIKKDKVALPLRCPAGAAGGCRGSLDLQTAAKVRKPGASSGSKARRAVAKVVKYQIKAGGKLTVRVKLTPLGKRLLPRGKVVKLRVELSAPGSKKPSVIRVIRVRR